MLPNDDLARWGEPPTDDRELALAELLAEILDRDLQQPAPEATITRVRSTAPAATQLLEVCHWIDDLIGTVIEQSAVLENMSPPAGPGVMGGPAVQLRLCVTKLLLGGGSQPVA